MPLCSCLWPASFHPIVRSPLPGWRGAGVIDLMAGRSQGGSMHRKLIALAAAVSIFLLVSGVAAASITLFEPLLFRLGSVNGQMGVGPGPWKSSPPGTITVSIGRSQPPQQLTQDSTTRRLSPAPPLLPAILLGSASNRCVCRTHVRLVSSPTRRIPHRSHYRSVRRGSIRCSSPSSRLCPRRPPTSPDCS